MLKSAILCVLLWHEMCEFSTRAHPSTTETHILNIPARVSPKINYTDVQIEPKMHYYFNITILNMNTPLLGPTASAIAPITYPRRIPPGKDYLVTNGIGAHKLHYKESTWNDAREICINEGGDLVVIASHLESKLVLDMIQESALDAVWIGFRNRFGKEDWISVFNETLGENGWMHWYWKTNIHKPNQCAVFVLSDYPYGTGMAAYNCDLMYKFVCKITTI